jgi:hypothetical protein
VILVSGQTIKPPHDNALPEIYSVQPMGAYGVPHLRPGKPVVLIGKNFAPALAKNRVILRVVRDDPQAPPADCEYGGEIHLTSATTERLEGVAPLGIHDGHYMLYVRVENDGISNPMRIWLGAQASPPPRPIITEAR